MSFIDSIKTKRITKQITEACALKQKCTAKELGETESPSTNPGWCWMLQQLQDNVYFLDMFAKQRTSVLSEVRKSVMAFCECHVEWINIGCDFLVPTSSIFCVQSFLLSIGSHSRKSCIISCRNRAEANNPCGRDGNDYGYEALYEKNSSIISFDFLKEHSFNKAVPWFWLCKNNRKCEEEMPWISHKNVY